MRLEIADTLDAFQHELSHAMEEASGLEVDKCEYMDNAKLEPHWLSAFLLSRTRYQIMQADSTGKLHEIQNHVDPIGIQATASKKISRGLFRSHRHEVDVYSISLSRLEQIQECEDPGPELHNQTIEVLGEFCDNDHETAIEYYWTVEDELARRY